MINYTDLLIQAYTRDFYIMSFKSYINDLREGIIDKGPGKIPNWRIANLVVSLRADLNKNTKI